MIISVRWLSQDSYPEVVVEDGSTKLTLGLLDADERRALAQVFREAIEDLREPLVPQRSGE